MVASLLSGFLILKLNTMQRYYYIYIITNTLTLKSYVGSRLYEYKEPYWGSSKNLTKEIEEFGFYNFSKQVIGIYSFIDKKELLDRETFYVREFNTLYPSGYNRCEPNNYKGLSVAGIKGIKKQTKICDKCNKPIPVHLYKRFHGENCKVEQRRIEKELKKSLPPKPKPPKPLPIPSISQRFNGGSFIFNNTNIKHIFDIVTKKTTLHNVVNLNTKV